VEGLVERILPSQFAAMQRVALRRDRPTVAASILKYTLYPLRYRYDPPHGDGTRW